MMGFTAVVHCFVTAAYRRYIIIITIIIITIIIITIIALKGAIE